MRRNYRTIHTVSRPKTVEQLEQEIRDLEAIRARRAQRVTFDWRRSEADAQIDRELTLAKELLKARQASAVLA